jgi:hypothetical protein
MKLIHLALFILCIGLAMYLFNCHPLASSHLCLSLISGGASQVQRSYAINGLQFNPEYPISVLKRLGWIDGIENNIDYIDFVMIMAPDDKKMKLLKYKPALIKNVFDDKKRMSNKWILYNEMTKLPHVDYMPCTYLPNKFPSSKFGKAFIVRPLGGFAGKGVYVIKNMTKKRLRKLKKHEMVSEYIMDLDLKDGKVYHLRVNAIVCIVKGVTSIFYDHNFITYLTAGVPWSIDNMDDPNAHDSHYKSTIELVFLRDAQVLEQIHSILVDVFKVFSKDFSIYPESKHAFDVFGCDFMVRKNKKVMLIETNLQAGLKRMPHDQMISLFDGIFNNVISPVVYGKLVEYNNWTRVVV